MNLQFWSLKFWKDIGYSLHSSSYLARRLISIAGLQNEGIILELGAGSGQVTGYILHHKPKHSKLISIENDSAACKKLQQKFGNECEIHEISAAHIGEIIEPNSIDIIISTLPLGSISHDGVDAILRSAQNCLKPGGKFIQYQYWMYNRKDIKRYFTIDKTYWEPRNIGPAFIYKAHKK